MGTKVYNKLVRDNIPEIFKGNCTYRTLTTTEYEKELKNKLIEEAKEFAESTSVDQSIEELADVLEVITAILKLKGWNHSDVLSVANAKAKVKGRFIDRVFLISTTDKE